MQLHRSLQKVGLHKKREPQLVGECQGLSCVLSWASLPGQRQGQCPREPRNQGLHTSEACDGGAEWSEAPQSCEDPAEQEDGPFLRTSPDRHHRCHQARLGGGEEDLHAGGQTGEKSLVKALLELWRVTLMLFVVSCLWLVLLIVHLHSR